MPNQNSHSCIYSWSLIIKLIVHSSRLTRIKRRYTVTRYTTDKCETCPVRKRCTSNIRGRFIERPSHQNAVDRNTNRINKHKEYYRRRQAIVEHPFGTMKRQWHIDHTLLHGKENVITEYRIAAIAYNLCRSLVILERNELIKQLKALISAVLSLVPSISTPAACRISTFVFQPIKQHIYTRRISA